MPAFHDVLFPLDVAVNGSGGPVRKTEIVSLASGREERNTRWANSRRRYDAGYGVKSLDALHAVIAFFEERRGRLYGFRWRDRADWKSCAPQAMPTSADQAIGTGTGTLATFQLVKKYGSNFAPWTRDIRKPVAGTFALPLAELKRCSARIFQWIPPPASSPFCLARSRLPAQA